MTIVRICKDGSCRSHLVTLGTSYHHDSQCVTPHFHKMWGCWKLTKVNPLLVKMDHLDFAKTIKVDPLAVAKCQVHCCAAAWSTPLPTCEARRVGLFARAMSKATCLAMSTTSLDSGPKPTLDMSVSKRHLEPICQCWDRKHIKLKSLLSLFTLFTYAVSNIFKVS